MSRLIARLRFWLGLPAGESQELSDPELARLASQIASSQESEFDCEDTYRLLDQFAEAVARGEETEPWIPRIRAHLDRCQDCQAEFEALLQILQSTDQ